MDEDLLSIRTKIIQKEQANWMKARDSLVNIYKISDVEVQDFDISLNDEDSSQYNLRFMIPKEGFYYDVSNKR